MAVVQGRIDVENAEALFRATVDCFDSEPSGSIFGCFEAEINDRDFQYVFRADKPSSVVAS